MPTLAEVSQEVFGDDEELIGFVRRLVGYSLTGDTREHALIVFHGAGANGKTTFVEPEEAPRGLSEAAGFDTFARTR